MTPGQRNLQNQELLKKQAHVNLERFQHHHPDIGEALTIVWLSTPLCGFVVVVSLDSWVVVDGSNSPSFSLEQLKALKYVRCYAYATNATWYQALGDLANGRIYLR